MAHRRAALACAAASLLVVLGALAGCASEPAAPPTASPGRSAPGEPSPVETEKPDPSASATAAAVPLPTDCRAILTAPVLQQLADIPLNDPATEVPAGVQADGSLVCFWGVPGDDSSYLITTISYVSRGAALDGMNTLADEQGYVCYTPDGGTRCEKTWFSDPGQLPQGQTLFWRDDIMIDTQFTSLAPTGYTDAIVASVFD